jgi:uncharacterized protein (DUF2236 family)
MRRCIAHTRRRRQREVYQQFAIFGTALQVPAEKWPKDRAAFYQYYEHVLRNDLVVLPEAKAMYYHLKYPKVPLYYKPLMAFFQPIFRVFALELLPADIALELEVGPAPGIFARMAAAWIVMTWRWMPAAVRQRPMNFYMRRTKKMVETLKERGFQPDMRMVK